MIEFIFPQLSIKFGFVFSIVSTFIRKLQMAVFLSFSSQFLVSTYPQTYLTAVLNAFLCMM